MALSRLSSKNRIWYVLQGYEIDCFTDDFGKGRLFIFNNAIHRHDGPAVEWADGLREWYLNGKRHREDGPAYERADGYHAWYLNDKSMTEEEHRKAVSETKNVTA